jgi:diadenosine tetraphosphatase ApaH/serine/threonine PP2A family protein phosphatase
VIGLLYDVHGNLSALEAVLADAQAAEATRYVLGGDCALFGPYPAETVGRLRALDAEWIRGNGERWTARPGEAPDNAVVQGAIASCRELLDEDTVVELGSGRPEIVIDGTRYCHGSPVSDVRSFFPQPRDEDEELLGEVEEPRLVFGHTHLPFERQGPRGIELVNPGSVGMPFDGDVRAAYALVHDDGRIEHRRIEYDHGASAQAVRDRFPDWGDEVARRIEQAAFKV